MNDGAPDAAGREPALPTRHDGAAPRYAVEPTPPMQDRSHLARRDFIKCGMGALAGLGLGELIRLYPGELLAAPPSGDGRAKPGTPKMPNDYRRATAVPSVCLNCSTVCGIVGYVIDGKLVKLAGNPLDPNNGPSLCAKGQSGVTINNYPERLLYPLRRVGRRGEGLWERIGWEDAYREMAERIGRCIDREHPEQVAIHVGRSRINDVLTRFLHAIGSPVLLNHRGLCSSNKRAANYAAIGDSDWETVDAERTKYLLNFGSNFYEAHQGHIHFLKRVVKGRFDNGAKLVTFDVRLSNTAGRSDEWFAPLPGTEGAIALAMAHAIVASGEYDRGFVETWTNVTPQQLAGFLDPYTPDWAARLSGIPAADIERLAMEFVRCRPHCAAFTNRGSQAHYNGFWNDRAVILLNVLAGSINQPGGYCFLDTPSANPMNVRPDPAPPAPRLRTDLEDPPEWPLANHWQAMKVGQIVYAYLKEKRARLEVYFSYTLASPTTWPEGRSLAVEVLRDEELLPFHVCSDVVYSETAHYADLILPDATYLERWGLDSRNNYELVPYFTLRQPITPPPADCVSFADVLIELGKRLGPAVARYFPFKDHADYVARQCAVIPPGDCEDGFAYMKKHGVWVDPARPKSYNLHAQPLDAGATAAARLDAASGLLYQSDPQSGKRRPIGLIVEGQAVRGFSTPSRKIEIHSPTVAGQAAKVGFPDDGMPRWVPIPAHEALQENHFLLVTFKWNVHTQGRTAPQKYLSEIVHHNPMWINATTAARLGIRSGDLVEVTTYRPKGHTFQATGEVVGTARLPVVVTEGIHPRVLAVSNSLGQLFGGRAATARGGPRDDHPGFAGDAMPDDPHLEHTLWWDERHGGRGAGYNINAILPIQPSPLVGMQGWYDTVCTIRKV